MLHSLKKLLKVTFDRVYFGDQIRRTEANIKISDPTTVSRVSVMQRLLVGGGKVLNEIPQIDMATQHTEDAKRKVRQRVMQFLGIPHFNNRYNYSLLAILKYFLDWDDVNSFSFNLVKAPFFFIINLLTTLGRFSINFIKLLTEFLPRVLFAGVFQLAEVIFDKLINLKKGFLPIDILSALGMVVGGLVVGPVLLVLGLWYFIGCAATSPADTMRSAYNTGDVIANRSFLGKVLGVLLATVSILTTACVYAILFPLAIKLLVTQAPTVLPAIANTISQVVGSFSASAGTATANFLTVTLPGFLEGWGAIISAWFVATSASVTGFLSTWLFTAPAIVGLTGLSAIVFSSTTVAAAAFDKIGETTCQDLADFPPDFGASLMGACGNGVEAAMTVKNVIVAVGGGVAEGAVTAFTSIQEGIVLMGETFNQAIDGLAIKGIVFWKKTESIELENMSEVGSKDKDRDKEDDSKDKDVIKLTFYN